MIFKLLISGATGTVIISLILLFYSFNPLHNEPWLISAAAIAIAGTLAAELTSQKKPRKELRKLLKTHLKSLPASSPEWQPSIELLEAMRQAENWQNEQP